MQRMAMQFIRMLVGGFVVALILISVRAGAQSEVNVDAQTPHQATNIADATLDVQSNMQYQGILLDAFNTPKPSGTYNITFRLYDAASGGAVVWQETRDVVVASGFFSILLGQSQSIPTSIFSNKQLYLGVQVSGDSEMTPRQQLAVSPYAYWAYAAKSADKAQASDKLTQLRAYGVVNGDGSKHRGFNFSSSRQTIDNELTYRIDIEGEDYNLNDYVTTVTVVKNTECPGPVVAMTGSKDGDLLIDLYQPNGSRIYCKFHFQTLTLN